MSEEQNVTQQVSEPSTNEAQKVDNPTPQFTIPTEALDFVGEGKKYKSAEEALKSVPHAQEHIKTLEEEMAQLKEELAKRKAAEELLDELKSGIQPQQTVETVGIDQDRLMQLVNQQLEQRDKQSKAQANTNLVANKFTEKFGAQAEAVYNALAKDSGLTTAQLHNLSATSPTMVLKLAGIEAKATPIAKTSGSVNTESLSGKTNSNELSARVPRGASTKDLVQAWKNAGEKVKSQL
jgi:vacuolar-type H+-ATPase subunit I/STV1